MVTLYLPRLLLKRELHALGIALQQPINRFMIGYDFGCIYKFQEKKVSTHWEYTSSPFFEAKYLLHPSKESQSCQLKINGYDTHWKMSSLGYPMYVTDDCSYLLLLKDTDYPQLVFQNVPLENPFYHMYFDKY